MRPRQLDQTFSALSDGTRRAILARLMRGEATVAELAKPFNISGPAITKHLKVLEKAGLIQRSRDAQRRPCRLNVAPLAEVSDWLAQYRQFWEARLDRLDDYVRELQAVEAPPQMDDRVLIITRLFDAPRELVFAMWTEPAHFGKWPGPRSHPTAHVELDLRPGGAWRACLRSTTGERELLHSGVFREIAEPERLVFTFSRNQSDDTPGHETLITVTFEDRAGKTLIALRQAAFETIESRDDHRTDWSSAFDRLGECLSALQQPAIGDTA
jgi:uncharacterized protein YndB with AHSA1/START domain/DNA-binding transcriptional ArsR family regulator